MSKHLEQISSQLFCWWIRCCKKKHDQFLAISTFKDGNRHRLRFFWVSIFVGSFLHTWMNNFPTSLNRHSVFKTTPSPAWSCCWMSPTPARTLPFLQSTQSQPSIVGMSDIVDGSLDLNSDEILHRSVLFKKIKWHFKPSEEKTTFSLNSFLSTSRTRLFELPCT